MTNQTNSTPIVDPRLPDETFKDWCKRRVRSVWKGYQMIREGTAPRTIKIGRLRTVPASADAEWEAKYLKVSSVDPADSTAARARCRGE